ncbi:MAG: HNH endonuclease [Bacteroides sp.]|jgi:hypothetical protein|nr:HNH endonuclease [Bacteroides sp.]
MSKTNIPIEVKRQLWFKAHGRCEFNGCNKRLDVNGVTFDQCDLSNAAHIIADSPQGPRGNDKLSKELAKDEKNLMLMCPECHKYIDHEGAGKYSAEQLLKMKKEHENRIEMLTAICPSMKSLVVLYGANVGHDTPLFCKDDIYYTITPEHYPACSSPVSIELKNSSFYDSREQYWIMENEQLMNKCKFDVLGRLSDKEISHVSLFAFAPQPLLVKLGTLLNDKFNVDVYQKHREPDSWAWQIYKGDNSLKIVTPGDKTKEPVIVFALSSDTIIERINKRFAGNASIWIVTCEHPNNDMLKSKDQSKEFRMAVRNLINGIETETTYSSLKMFMAMPAALAVELGRIRMEKANMEWVLYDYIREMDEDFETIKIINNE